MLYGQELTLFDFLMISVVGMLLVFFVLMLVLGLIKLMSFYFQRLENQRLSNESGTASAVATASDDGEDEAQAVIMAVISEDLQIPLDELRFKSIKPL